MIHLTAQTTFSQEMQAVADGLNRRTVNDF